MRRKLGFEHAQIRTIVDTFIDQMILQTITAETIRSALRIAERYGFSYYDSQVLASALESHCPLLYSEDLQHGQKIEGVLRIVNPFLLSSAKAPEFPCP